MQLKSITFITEKCMCKQFIHSIFLKFIYVTFLKLVFSILNQSAKSVKLCRKQLFLFNIRISAMADAKKRKRERKEK